MQFSWTDIAAVAGSFAVVVLGIYLVGLIKKAADVLFQAQSTLLPQVQATMAALERAADAHAKLAGSIEAMASVDIPPVVRNVERVSANLCDLTGDIKEKLRQTQGVFDAAMDTCETVMAVSLAARSGLTGAAAHITGIASGIRASIEFLKRNFTKKGGSYEL